MREKSEMLSLTETNNGVSRWEFAVAVGIGLGSTISAMTAEAIWIAIGPAPGVVIGAAIGYRDA